MRNMQTALAFMSGLLTGVALCQSQSESAVSLRVNGKVADPTGYPIPQAEVTIKSHGLRTATHKSTTNPNGIFTFDIGLAHQCELEFRKPGFKILHKSYEVAGNQLELGTIVLEISDPDPDLPVPPDFAPLEPLPSPINTVLSPIAGGSRIRGRYVNVEYGFRVDVPAGLTGEGSIPPAPTHGFTILFAENSVAWIDASYEMPDSRHVFRRFNARLGRLKAEQRYWNDPQSDHRLRHESIVARRLDGHTPIIYTIWLDAPTGHWASGIRLFEALKRSFQTIPVFP